MKADPVTFRPHLKIGEIPDYVRKPQVRHVPRDNFRRHPDWPLARWVTDTARVGCGLSVRSDRGRVGPPMGRLMGRGVRPIAARMTPCRGAMTSSDDQS